MSTSTKPYTHNQFWLTPSTQPYVHSQFWLNTSTQPYAHNQFRSSPTTQPYPHDGNENACPTPAHLRSNQGSWHACTNAMACTRPMNRALGELPKLWRWCKLSYLGNDSHEEKWQLGWCFFEVHNGECGNLLQDPNYKPNLGVPITSLWSHLSITQSRKRGKARVLQKEVEVALVEYMKMMQAIKHLITFTQLHLNVVEITQKSSTLFKNGIPRWG